jgi:hypothetical protein
MLKIFGIALLLGAVLTSCGGEKNKAPTPEEIGAQVLVLLEDMSEITRPEFTEYFISAKEIKGISKNKELVKDEDQRRILSTTTKESMKVRYTFMYKRLKQTGMNLGINWSKIFLKSFDYELEERRGSKFYNGVLVFAYKKRNFSIETSSIFDGNDYILVSVSNLSELK